MSKRKDKYRIGKVFGSVTTPKDALNTVKKAVVHGVADYICVASMRTIYVGYQNTEYAEVVNNALMCLPDGMPLVWVAKAWGMEMVERTSGPELFLGLLTDSQNSIKHFLLGDTDDTLEAIKKKYPDSIIVGSYSPPFCKVEDFNYPEIARLINDSNADIVWIALQAPKQDFFSVKLLPLLNHALCIGVGAAFRFSLGQYKMPPMIFQKLGLTGLFWRKMDKAVLMDYFHAIPCIIKILIMTVCGRWIGKKYYE